MIEKLVSSEGFFEDGEPQMVVIKGSSEGVFTKQAADEQIIEFVRNLVPDPSKTYVHINAMGAGEYYGSNKNGDYFPEKNLIEYYKTFETSPGYIYRHHINKDPKKSIGKVIFAIYNTRMHRVELIAEIDKTLGADIEAAIASGKYPFTSMACKTPYDVCSICGNKASSRAQYCSHLSNSLNKLMPDGKKVMAINLAPLRFFDQSIVIRPADVTSSVLQKVASAGVVGSAEEAEGVEFRNLDGDSIKTASLKKLSELQKMIEGGNVVNAGLSSILNRVSDPSPTVIDRLRSLPISDIFNGLAEAGISPSLSFLAELIAAKFMGDEYRELSHDAVAQFLNQGVTSMPPKVMNSLGDMKEARASLAVHTALRPYLASSSLLPEFVEKRATEVGYTPSNYYLEETPPGVITPSSAYNRVSNPGMVAGSVANAAGLHSGNLISALLTIGGIALISKLYINSLIDKKLSNMHQNFYTPPQNRVKILLEKSGSSTELTSILSNMSLVLDCKADFQKKANSGIDSSDVLMSTASSIIGNSHFPISKPTIGAIKILKSIKRLGINQGNEVETK